MSCFVLSVSGPPGAGKSHFCKVFAEYLKSLGRKVKLVNLDPACEQSLAYTADWTVTTVIKVSDIQKEKYLGFNGALMRAMTMLASDLSPLLDEINSYDHNTFVIMDLPGQVELYTSTNEMQDIFGKLSSSGYQLCNIYLTDATVLREIDFFIAYTTSVSLSMTHLEVPQVNLLSKVDLLVKAKKKMKLPIPFRFYANWRNAHLLVDKLTEDKNVHPNHMRVIHALATVVEAYGLVDYMPCTLIDKRFLQLILYQLDRAVGYFPKNPEDNFKLVNAVLELMQTEKDLERAVEDILSRCHSSKSTW